MVGEIDSNELKQITGNIYDKKTEIYIPCLKTYGDLLGEENEFTNSTEIFFEFSAHHKSKYTELKNRKNPVRVFRTSPIVEDLLNIANKEWEENKSDRINAKIELAFSATEPQMFDSVMPSSLSTFEKANVLKEECGDSVKLIIISNNPKIDEIKKIAENEAGRTFDNDFKIMTTDKWVKWRVEEDDKIVKEILFNQLLIKKEMKIGSHTFKLN